MALIKCEECSADVSDIAKSCPVCGAPKWKIRSLTPEHFEKRKRNEEIKAKKIGIAIGVGFSAIAILLFISSQIHHYKPIHGKFTTTDLLADVTGWNETVRTYKDSDSYRVKCSNIKANHKALVSFSSGSNPEIKMWEKRWRDNKCKNG